MLLFTIISIVFSYIDNQDYRVNQSCSTSLTGYYWNSQQCIQCKYPTCICNEQSSCSGCISNYYYDEDESTCIQCPFGCLSCCKNDKLTQYICTQCQDGYTLISGVCVQINFCYEISIHARCIECIEGYYLNDTCIQCPEGCTTCDTEYYCTECDDGYYFNIVNDTYICQSCDSQLTFKGCATCTYDDESLKMYCDSCLPNYYYYEDEQKCTSCSDNCSSCQDPQIIPQICFECDENYILSSDETSCQNCQDQIPNCMICTENSISAVYECDYCYNGYYFDDESSECVSCNDGTNNVRRCESKSEITQCIPGYVLYENECIKNQHNCLSINNDSGQCENCTSDYQLIYDSNYSMNICKQCTTISNCISCSSSNSTLICTTCQDKFYVNNGQCIKCSNNCSICNQDECTQCDDSYFLSSGNCVNCELKNCKECTNANDCTLCIDGYGLIDDQCQQCLTGCKNCDGDINSCNECIAMYYLTEGDSNCKRYKDNCLATNLNGYCYLCQTIIYTDESQNQFQDEDEEINNTSTNTTQESIFYISDNGYCLLCNDYETGIYNCPNECATTENYKIILFITYLIMIQF